MVAIRYTDAHDYAALQAINSDPSKLGRGVIAINYADAQDHGNYTLYLQIEHVR